jgi:hypothetical protein
MSSKKQKRENDEIDGITVFSNKTVDETKIPPKPANLGKKKDQSSKNFDFRLTFTNGVLLQKFLDPASHAVQKMRFVICQPQKATDFQGFKIECVDQAFTLADRGIFECDVQGLNADGITFCVSADAFMEALVSSTLRETDLSITRYSNEDKVTFESTNNDNDVRTVYACNLIDSTSIDSLDGISIELGFHVNVHMHTIKELSLNAKRCGAPTLHFDLFQANDQNDKNIIHSKMRIGFTGTNTSGSHDFFISTRKEVTGESVKWIPLTTSSGFDDSLKMEKKCSNEYDNNKLRLFLNHMDCQYVLVHLCTDNTIQPLVLEFTIGGARTKHTVIVAPKETGTV